MLRALLVGILFFAQSLVADPIVWGKTSGYCRVEVTSEQPFAEAGHTPVSAVTPSTVPDLSGKWRAGCFWAVVSTDKTTPTGDPIYSKSTIFPENVWTKADLNGEPDLVKWHEVTIAQDAWHRLSFTSATQKGPFHGAVLDFQHQLNYRGHVGFWRECKAGAHSWKRTYDMPLTALVASRWAGDGSRFWGTTQIEGTDKNYAARHLSLRRSLFQIEKDRLVVKTATWTEHLNYNPIGFNPFPYDFGGRICVLERAK